MLKEFSIRNYKSIKDEITFTMEADVDNVSEHPEHVIRNKHGDSILKLGSIYGPNAGGKTTLIRSMLLLESIIAPRYYSNNIPRHYMFDLENFKFTSKKIDKIIELRCFFIDDQYEFGYEVSFEKVENEEGMFIKYHTENLSYRKLGTDQFVNVFDRIDLKIESKILVEELSVPFFSVADTISFVSFLETSHINKTSLNTKHLSIIDKFIKQVRSIKYYRGIENHINDFIYGSIRASSTFGTLRYKNESLKNKVVTILNNLDISISDIVVKKEGDRRRIYCEHTIEDKKFLLRLEQESEGTVGLINMLPYIIDIIEDGGIMIADELDAHLHPKLIKKIIELFGSNINSKAQLIFNSHDIWNMTNDNFRRDEIWFVYRNNEMSTELVCLSDYINYKGEKIKVRKDAKFCKQYMEGKYGADPFIEKGVLWNE